MCKRIFLLLVLGLSAGSLFGQVSGGFYYQAVARNQDGTLVKNQTLTLRVGILQGGAAGTLVWQEDHTVSTNDFGLFSLVIGDPAATPSGGSLGAFDEIDWSLPDYFLKVEVDLQDGNGYHAFDPVPFLSVPYAQMAGEVTGRWGRSGDTLVFNEGSVTIGTTQANGSKLAVQGDDVASSKPLFEVKRQDGQTVFAVYNDSIRMFVNANETAKGGKGGFAIGGFGAAKGTFQDYLKVTPDSVRVYIDQSAAKGPGRGGFAIGGFGVTKGATEELMHLDINNYFIGHQSGLNITTGVDNVFLGNHAGFANQSGSTNVFLGFEAGYNNTTGSDNVLLGYRAGYDITTGENNITIGSEAGYRNDLASDNIFLGRQAGYNHIYGNQSNLYKSNYNIYIGHLAGYGSPDGDSSNLNIFIGNQAGYSIKSGSDNIFIGDGAGYSNVTSHWNVYLGLSSGKFCTGAQNVFIGGASGSWANGTNNCYIGAFAGRGLPSLYNTGYGNTFFGYYSGIGNSTGSDNVFLGMQTGANNGSGNDNVYIGYYTANQNSGSGNVFIGNSAGSSETTANNKLIIANNNSSNLVEGDFSKNTVTINDVLKLTPRSSAPASPVAGQIYVNTNGHIYCYLGGVWKQLDN